jgi:hypothetical protein
MGYRGSKSDSYISVKEQRADGYSIILNYCKGCSRCLGNQVYMHPIFVRNVSTISGGSVPRGVVSYGSGTSGIRTIFINVNKYLKNKTNNFQKQLFSSEPISINTRISKLNSKYVTGFTDGEGCFYVGVSAEPRCKLGYRVNPMFQIGLHVKDLAPPPLFFRF